MCSARTITSRLAKHCGDSSLDGSSCKKANGMANGGGFASGSVTRDSGYVTGDQSAGHRIVRAGGSQSADEASDEKPAASVNSEGESSEESESEAEGMCV